MASVKELAERHCRRLTGEQRYLFMLGFHVGQQAVQTDENTARVLHRLVATDTATAAGYLEGIAAARAVA